MAFNTAVFQQKDFRTLQLKTFPKDKVPFFQVLSEILTYVFLFGAKCCVIALFAIASMILGIKTYTHVYQTDYFSVEDVAVTGLQKLTRDEILSLAAIQTGGNTFQMDLESISQSVKKNPWVEKVTVKRELPRKFIIDVTERKPIARLYEKEKLFLIDGKGYLLEEIQKSEYENLPVIGGASLEKTKMEGFSYPPIFKTALDLLKLSKEINLFDVSISGIKIENRNEMILVTRNPKAEIRLAAGNIGEALYRLGPIFEYAKMEEKVIRSIDMCYENKAIVKFTEESKK